MGKIGTTELILIFSIAILIFGPSRLPILGKFAGNSLGKLKGYVDNITDEFEELENTDNEKKENVKKIDATLNSSSNSDSEISEEKTDTEVLETEEPELVEENVGSGI